MSPETRILESLDSLYAAAADYWCEVAAEAVRQRGAFHVALSGGSSPRALFERLAAAPWCERVAWERVHVWFGDERCVPPNHPDSNYRMVREALLERVPIPAGQVHPMTLSMSGIRRETAAYGRLLEDSLLLDAAGIPILDLVMLGMGADGHTASLFPGTCALNERQRPVVAVYVDKLHAWRGSITFPVIAAARRVMLLVAGAEKAEAVARAFGRREGPPPPVAGVPREPRVIWFLDRAAAREV